MDRQQALARRIHAQQLDRAPAPRPATDAAVLDLGVQDTGRDGASWALVNRGVPLASPEELESDPALALAWTLRSSPPSGATPRTASAHSPPSGPVSCTPRSSTAVSATVPASRSNCWAPTRYARTSRAGAESGTAAR